MRKELFRECSCSDCAGDCDFRAFLDCSLVKSWIPSAVVFTLGCQQVHNYGSLIRSDDGEKISAALMDMLKVFLICKSNTYTGALILALLNLMYLRENHAVVNNLWEHHARVFYEEAAEVSLSHLARVNQSSTHKQDIKKLSDAFVMGASGKCATEVWERMTDNFRLHRGSGAKVVGVQDAEVIATVVWLRRTITALELKGNFQHYSQPRSRDAWFDIWKNAATARQTLISAIQVPFWWSADTSTELKSAITRSEQNIAASD